jgi:hypothetical protein
MFITYIFRNFIRILTNKFINFIMYLIIFLIGVYVWRYTLLLDTLFTYF